MNDRETNLDNVYEKIKVLMRKYGRRENKKHGDFYIIAGNGEYLALDTWNGYINLIKGEFTGTDTFHKGELIARPDTWNVKATRYSLGLAYQFILKHSL